MTNNINTIVDKANTGDKKALELIIHEVKDMVYNLSLKMLLFPEDAKDATQDILIKVITRLSTFKGESQFSTWVFRIATNHLLTTKGKRSKEFAMPFDDYAQLIDTGQSNAARHAKNEGELFLLEEEVKVSCTHGLLLCLTAKNRIIYIIGDILDFNSVEAAEIVGLSPVNFRKQLSRARAKIRNFIESKCGLANPENPCRCSRKIDFLTDQKIIDPSQLRFAKAGERSMDLMHTIQSLEKSTAIYRSVQLVESPETILEEIKETLNTI